MNLSSRLKLVPVPLKSEETATEFSGGRSWTVLQGRLQHCKQHYSPKFLHHTQVAKKETSKMDFVVSVLALKMGLLFFPVFVCLSTAALQVKVIFPIFFCFFSFLAVKSHK